MLWFDNFQMLPWIALSILLISHDPKNPIIHPSDLNSKNKLLIFQRKQKFKITSKDTTKGKIGWYEIKPYHKTINSNDEGFLTGWALSLDTLKIW